ncbi:hypothetical protein INS49_012554 [Diaporthe citri]|uniref:uncharacterized protein n=1 Tax=Diaporthe citri TaxID=83186 RepID=UPI001C7E5A08|nr:uncharacterized protein INS49_012554 [Diaporthe citri]KAG6359034.1 hypothetical protein INS49_012554 [Diaporthe citri]
MTKMIQRVTRERARLEVVKATNEYQLACHHAVRANRLEFELEDVNIGGLLDSASMGNDSSDEDGDGRSTFDQCTVYAIVRPDGNLPPDRIATLRMAAIAESQVNIATFRGDILETVLDVEPLAHDLLDRHGAFRSGIWGCGSPKEGTGVWGSEFGRGLLVFIEHVDVKHSLRGIGVGTKLFKQVLDWVKKKARELGQPAEACSYLVVAPGSLRQDVVREFGEGNFFTGDYGTRQAEVDGFMEKQAEKSKMWLPTFERLP